MRRHFLVLLVLALTQITGWGAVGVLPVIAPSIAAEFGASLPSIFLGTSVMYAAMGLAAPWVGRAFRRFGTHHVMTAGAGTIGLGLCVVSRSPSIAVFWVAWALTGLGGAMFLTTAAYAYIAEHEAQRARGLVGTLMLVTGLAGSVFWPITALLESLVGWRGVVLVHAAVMTLAVCPSIWFGLPATGPAATKVAREERGRRGHVFILLVAAIALNSFVTFGIEAVGIQLLQAMGMDLAGAVAIASLLGAFKVGGRVIDLLGGRKWDGLSTALVSGAMIPLGLIAIWIGGAGILSVVGYLALFGIGSGAFAVARATMPLVFFERADYAAAMATIALPMNLINALAPPVLATLMAGIGAQTTFAILGGLSLSAFAVLLKLNGMRLKPAVGK